MLPEMGVRQKHIPSCLCAGPIFVVKGTEVIIYLQFANIPFNSFRGVPADSGSLH